MRKYFYFAAAAMMLASCANEDYIGNEGGKVNASEYGEITFGGTRTALTRADHTGSDAAGLLDNNFVVEGIKYVNSNKVEVFDHYNVNWVTNTANTTTSNTADWEYVAQDQNIKGTSSKLSAVQAQTIKYWDYAATQYDYVAVSLGKGFGSVGSETYAELSEIDYTKIGTANAVYTLTGTTQELAAAYIADLVSVYNTDASHRQFNTGEVTPHFRSLGTKIRFAFYETIPGYSVNNVKFYSSASAGTSGTVATLYTADGTTIYPVPGEAGTMSISYPTVGVTNYDNRTTTATDYNKAHVSFAAASGAAKTGSVWIGNLNYQTNPELGEATGKYLGRTSNTATYALPAGAAAPTTEGADPVYYEVVLPYETGAQLNLKVDYTLTSTDGSGETITVSGATAVVPQVYTRWMPNYAYTYIFKISQNTNGLTDPSQPVAGLYPITFDAVVTETTDGIQETVTTVSDPSITTYAKGANPTTSSEYATGSNIYVMVDNGTALDVATNAKLYTVTLGTGAAQTINEASVENALLHGTWNSTAKTYTVHDANGQDLVVTVSDLLQNATKIDATDAPNGNEIAIAGVKFTPTVAGTYAFVYTVSDAVAAVEYTYSEWNTAHSTTYADQAEYEAAVSAADRIKTPAVPADYQIKIIIVH